LDWLDFHVRGIKNDVADWKPVKVFVMGDNKWIEADEWPLKNTKYTPMYLCRDKNGKSSLRPEPVSGLEKSSFVADPENPVKDKYGTSMGAFDVSYISERPDVLTFNTEVLDKDIEVVGNIGAEIYLSADAPDCDLFVKVLDVHPDGKAYNIMPPGKEVMRVSYRDKTPDRKLLSPGQAVKLNFENMRTGNTFKKGHAIRVCITASWYPIYARNLQTGELESLSSKTQKATINIHHDGQFPSRIILPVIPSK
jgi:putative CocE/NonD family hydrolase